jgi:two-component system LytT family response regulator
MDKNILNEDKEDIFINIKSLPSPIMIIVTVLNFIKNNKYFIKLIQKYIKDNNIIYLFDEANISYAKNMSIDEYVKKIVQNQSTRKRYLHTKVLIIDDENRTRDLISKMIQSFDFNLQVFSLGENVQTAIQAIEKVQPDIVFLDIQMPDGTGFDVLKSLKDKKFEVIFITAHEEYAITAIKFSALDYLLKPVDPEELRNAIEKALKTIEIKEQESQFEALQNNILPNSKKRLVLKTHESVFVVELEQIIRCEADKNYTTFFLTSGKKIVVSKTLKEYEILLSAYNFLRVQQSHLINLDFIERYDKANGGIVVMKDGAEVPLSNAKREQFFNMLDRL